MSLDLIVPHLYGDHSKCAKESATWCSYLKNPSKFRYRSLPEGKPLTSVDLKSALTDVINNLKDRAAALTNLGSTQANENFNFIVSTKAPKNNYCRDQRDAADIILQYTTNVINEIHDGMNLELYYQ
uniref:Uncharacterized protein n=1 Tax=Magallana gigas TaxID=29159 RepID=K1QMG1_MAGGI